jgi:phenylacetate-coenzyme A ligase PaaK-like adenylate-forming protein
VKEFLIERRRVHHMDEVTLVIDCGTAAAPEHELSAELRRALGVRIDVRVAAPDSLPRPEAKAARVVTIP